ncbi:MAG: late competence development ComFB family protein [Firmicutes bacterium]|nr:late competence development ComFB family protein [Bacillota bacterium]
MSLENHIVKEIRYQLNRHLATHADAMTCQCSQCKEDVVALAANHLPPRYATSPRGRILVALELQNKQLQLDILKGLLKAIDQVNRRPQHDPNRIIV